MLKPPKTRNQQQNNEKNYIPKYAMWEGARVGWFGRMALKHV